LSTPAAPARSTLETLCLSGLFLLLVVTVWADPLFFRKNFAGRDLLGYGLPIESVIHDAYARGRLPVWNPWIAGGRPLLANPNSGALYPVRPLLALLPFPLAFRIFPLLHWGLAGIGTILLLRAIGVSRGAAWIGAVTYVFSGVVVSEAFYNNNHPGVMLVPWVAWAMAARFRTSVRQALVLATLFGLDLLAGDPFTIVLAFAVTLLWILLEVAPADRMRAGVTLVVSVALACLLALPQIVATMLWIPETNRGVLGMRLGEVLLFSLSPFRLLEFVIPYPFGDTWSVDFSRIWGVPVFRGRAVGFFSGLYAGTLAVVALFEMGRRRPPGARFARGLFLAGLLVTVPGSLLPARWAPVHSFLPLRYPEKFSVSLALALAILCALAFDALAGSRRRVSWVLPVGCVLALAAVGLRLFSEQAGWFANAVVGGDDSKASIATAVLPEAFAEGALLWMATVIALDLLRRDGRAAKGASLVLFTLVPILANRRIGQTFGEEILFAPTAFERFVSRSDPHNAFRTIGAVRYRAASALELGQGGTDVAQLQFCRNDWVQFMHALWKRGTIFNDDFDNGDLSRLESLRRASWLASTFMDAGTFFGAIALKWSIRYRDQIPLPGFHRVGGDGLMDWDQHEKAYPDIRLLTSWVEEASGLVALNDIPKLQPGQIVIESGGRVRGTARPGRIRIFEKSPERLRLETETQDPTWLFVVRGFWNHRRVLLDGRAVEDFPAQLAFSAVRVPAGRHTLEWRELLPGESVSFWGPALFALVAAGLVLSERRRERAR
jgi:hypothetical protein